MGHTQIYGLSTTGEITPISCDATGNLVVNASLALSGEALETTQLQVLSNIVESKNHLSDIDTALTGTLIVSDSVSQSKLDGVNSNLTTLITTMGDVDLNTDTLEALQTATNTKLDTVNTNLTGTLRIDPIGTTSQPVSVATLPLPSGASTSALQTSANGLLTSIDTSLSGTITVDGSAVVQPVSATVLPLPTGASTSALQTVGNTYLTNIDGKLTSGSGATVASALQVVAYGRDGAGNLDALNVDTSGHLKITVQDEEKDVSDANIWTAQVIANSSSATSSSIDMTLHKHILIMGNTTNTSDSIALQVSNDNTNFYSSDVFIYPNWQTGDFAYHLRDTPAKYVRLYKINNSGASETITAKSSKMKF